MGQIDGLKIKRRFFTYEKIFSLFFYSIIPWFLYFFISFSNIDDYFSVEQGYEVEGFIFLFGIIFSIILGNIVGRYFKENGSKRINDGYGIGEIAIIVTLLVSSFLASCYYLIFLFMFFTSPW